MQLADYAISIADHPITRSPITPSPNCPFPGMVAKPPPFVG
jgi:hypothetical protein